MQETDIEGAARALLQAARARVSLDGLPAGVRPATLAQAYAIQDSVAAMLGEVVAWKVGAKQPGQEPACAPLTTATVHASGCALPAADFPQRAVEVELAVRIGRDLPGRAEPYAAAEVSGAISAVLPTIELVESRYVSPASQDRHAIVADGLSHGALICGRDCPDTALLAAHEFRATLDADGSRVLALDRAHNPAGELLPLVVWLANHAARRCGGLKAGQVVTTGSLTGIASLAGAMHVEAAVEGLGAVSFDFR